MRDTGYEEIEEVIESTPPKWGCILILISPGLICALALFGSVLFCGNTFSGALNGVSNLFTSIGNIFNIDLFPSRTTIVSSAAIVQKVSPLGQLVTTRVELAQSRIEVSTRYGVANVCYIGALHSAQGFIEAGIDLKGFTDDDVIYDEQKNEYLIRLPAPTVTNCYLDPLEMIKYLDWGATIACPADWDEMRRLASYEAIHKFRDRAVDEGIIEKAQEQANLVVSNFVSSLTGAPVRIEFVPSESTIYPLTCMPQPPQPWRFNEEEARWIRD